MTHRSLFVPALLLPSVVAAALTAPLAVAGEIDFPDGSHASLAGAADSDFLVAVLSLPDESELTFLLGDYGQVFIVDGQAEPPPVPGAWSNIRIWEESSGPPSREWRLYLRSVSLRAERSLGADNPIRSFLGLAWEVAGEPSPVTAASRSSCPVRHDCPPERDEIRRHCLAETFGRLIQCLDAKATTER